MDSHRISLQLLHKFSLKKEKKKSEKFWPWHNLSTKTTAHNCQKNRTAEGKLSSILVLPEKAANKKEHSAKKEKKKPDEFKAFNRALTADSEVPFPSGTLKRWQWWNSWRIKLVSMLKFFREQNLKYESSKQDGGHSTDKFRTELHLQVSE